MVVLGAIIEVLGKFFRYFFKYFWVPLVLGILSALIYIFLRYGAFDAVTDWFNHAANAMFDTVQFEWILVVLESMMDWFGDNVGPFLQFLLGLPFIALIVVLAILFFVLTCIWALVALIIAGILMLLYFILSILLIYVVVPAAAVGAIILLIFLRRDAYEYEVLQTTLCVLDSISSVLIVVFYFIGISVMF